MLNATRVSYNWIYLLSGAAVFMYVLTRAVTVPFTHDECLSYRYLQYSVADILCNNTGVDLSANNHILNTLVMKFFHAIGGNREPMLRLHSILAAIVYIIYAYRIASLWRRELIALCVFLLLISSPYLLDFFSLARGYAMACAFVLVSLFHLIRYIQRGRVLQLAYCCLAMSLAVLSNFALILFCCAQLFVLLVAMLVQIRSRKISLLRACADSLLVLFPVGIMLWAYLVPLRALYAASQLSFGYATGFWENTVRSLIDTYLYEQPYAAAAIWLLNVVAIACAIAVPLAIVFLFATRRRKLVMDWHLVLLATLLITCGLSVLQHLVMGTAYLQERFALFLWPLIVLALISAVDIVSVSKKGYVAARLCSLLAVGFAVVHLCISANLSYSLNWRYDADTPQMLKDLENISRRDGRSKSVCGVVWYFEPTVNFYRQLYGLTWLQPVDRSWPDKDYDYHYITGADFDNLNNMNGRKVTGKKLLVRYPVTGNVLCLIMTESK